VPVDVISSQLLENTGAVETWQQLQRLVPSLNVPHIPIGDNHMRPVTLRGLAPHHVLVLVNGRRRHPAPVLLAGPVRSATSFTDLNAIPSSAIERIEVLRDGAAAQYGSDAIGGVVNVVLRSGAHREMRASTGTVLSSEGGRSFTDGRHFKAGGTYGVTANSGAHLTLSGEFQDRSGTNRAYPDRRPQYFPGDPGNDEPPRISSYLGNGDLRSATAFVTAGAPLGKRIGGYAVGGAAHRNGESPDAFFRRPLDPRTVRAIHPDGFLPVIGSSIVDLSALAGIRGSLYGWRWDVSSGMGRQPRRLFRAQHQQRLPRRAEPRPVQRRARRYAAVEQQRRRITGSHGRTRTGQHRRRCGVPAWTGTGSWQASRIPGGTARSRSSTGRRRAASAVGAQGMIGFRPADEVAAHRSSSAVYLEAEGRPLPRLLLQRPCEPSDTATSAPHPMGRSPPAWTWRAVWPCAAH
jgi:iron complex outermembrane recepter protein